MPTGVQRFRVLLSSPGNLAEEREIARQVADNINLDSGARDGFFVEIIGWETHTWPAAGEYPQATINDQLPDDIDIYIGIMGSYFGTPTKYWGSGTEEEFRIAFDAWKAHKKPEIMFYFSEVPLKSRDINIDQLAKKNNFRTEIGELGVRYEEYDDPTQFNVLLSRQLSMAIYDLIKTAAPHTDETPPSDQKFSMLKNFEDLLEQNPLYAANDLISTAAKHLNDHTTEMDELATDLTQFSTKLAKFTKRLTHANNSNSVQSQMDALSGIMNLLARYTSRLKIHIPKMNNSFRDSMVCMQRAINIIDTADLTETLPIGDNIKPMQGMLEALKPLEGQITFSSEAFAKWPDISPDMSFHRDVLLALHSDLTEYVRRSVKLGEDVLQTAQVVTRRVD